ELLPLRDEVAILIEHLDAGVLAVGDIDALLGAADEDVVRLVEIAGRRTLVAPLLDEFPVLGELHHAGIAGGVWLMAIGDEDVAVSADGDAGRPVEHVGAG